MSDPNAASSTAASSIWASSTPSSVSTNTILPPFESLSSTNQSGVVVIITLLLLSFVVLCFLARVYTRIYINGPWLRDDNVLTAATVEFQVVKVSVDWLTYSRLPVVLSRLLSVFRFTWALVSP